jgi:tetratricopeptide (TPR) repeat protein
LLDELAPADHRRWWVAASIVLTIGIVAFMSVGDRSDSATTRSCDEHSSRASEVWNAAVSDELERALTERGELARRSWPYLHDQLDRWIASWTAVDLELCGRYGLAPELRERQLLCLDRQLEHFELAADLLASATADELEHGFDLLARLPDPAACRDALVVHHPGIDAQQLAGLEVAVERVELEYELGRLAQADTSSAELCKATEKLGLEPLHVRVAVLRSSVLADLERREDAVEVAFSGLAAAERDGAAALRLQAFTHLVYVHVATSDLRGAKRWLAQAQAIAMVQEIDRELQRDLASTEAWVRAVDGRLEEAIAGYDRAIAFTDPVTEALEHGQLIVARAQLFGYLGKPEQALEQLVIGERELLQVIGPEHPEMLDVRNAKALMQLRLDQWEPARTELLAVAESLDALRGQPTAASIAARGHAAWLLAKLGDCAGARAEFEPLIPLAREHMVYPAADLGKLLTERAQLCEQGTPEAVEFAREALTLYRAAVGDQHVMVAAAHKLLALTLYEAGMLEAALEEVEVALTIFAAVDPIGAEFVPETEALARLIRERLAALR